MSRSPVITSCPNVVRLCAVRNDTSLTGEWGLKREVVDVSEVYLSDRIDKKKDK